MFTNCALKKAAFLGRIYVLGFPSALQAEPSTFERWTMSLGRHHFRVLSRRHRTSMSSLITVLQNHRCPAGDSGDDLVCSYSQEFRTSVLEKYSNAGSFVCHYTLTFQAQGIKFEPFPLKKIKTNQNNQFPCVFLAGTLCWPCLRPYVITTCKKLN